jgi:hypothetical protein
LDADLLFLVPKLQLGNEGNVILTHCWEAALKFFLGLHVEEKHLPRRLLERRRDIMMESYAYELIKKEGYEEGIRSGIEQGLQQGIEQGLRQGLQQGSLEATREHILETLEARFRDVPKDILQSLREIRDPDALKLVFRKALRADSLDDFSNALSRFLD